MSSQLSVISRNASARYHKLHISTQNGGIYRVASVTTTTIVFDDLSDLGGKALYTSDEPGMAVIVEGVNASDVGKTANITGITTNTATVDTDFSTTPALADGDLVAIVPPMASEVLTNGAHSIGVARTKDTSLGLTESVLTHNTAMQVDVGGTIPTFIPRDSEAFGRILAVGVGGYKHSSGTHTYRPFQLDDGTFTEIKDFCAYSKDGNGVVEQAFLGLFGSQLNLNFPQRGVANASLQVLGTHAIRAVNGTGKTFPSGTGNWNRGADIERDSGNRHVFNGVFVEFGGSFGDPLGDHDNFVQEANVQITRSPVDDNVLGAQDRMVPVEDTFGIKITGRRVLEDDSIYQDFFGSSASATPGQQTETRLLLKSVHPGDTTKTLTADVPFGTWTVSDIERQRGRFIESFTFEAKQQLASGVYDTANPLYQLTYVNGDSVDYSAAL